MKITEEIKKELKSLQIEDVAEALGLSIYRHKALCFVHDDRHPSLVFSTSSNSWKCYACGAGGDTIALVQQKLNIGFVDACKWLANEFHIIKDNDNYVSLSSTTRENLNRDRVGRQVDTEIMDYIVRRKAWSEDAKRFLFGERKYTVNAVSKLNIGSIWSRHGMAYSIVREFGEERALKSGFVYKRNEQYTLYFNTPCLIFPYYDVDGKLQNLQARYLGSEDKPRFQFPMGNSVPIFNLSLLKTLEEGSELYISEGVTDCIALTSSRHNAIAIPSATLLKDKDFQLLSRFKLLMYPDQDEPGERLFQKLKEGVENYSGSIERLNLPEGIKDYSEYYFQMCQSAANDNSN